MLLMSGRIRDGMTSCHHKIIQLPRGRGGEKGVVCGLENKKEKERRKCLVVPVLVGSVAGSLVTV